MAGVGMILHDGKGRPVFLACRFLEDCQTPMVAELQVGVEGLEMARHPIADHYRD
jgi:hypothetical protein